MEPLTLIIILLGIAVMSLSFFIVLLHKRIMNLTRGNKAKNLESIIIENNTLIKATQVELGNHSSQIREIQIAAMSNIQNIGIVRFNPFKETGGSQSFAIALTDKEKNGVIISSLYARDRVNVFAKPIINGESTYTLTNEEKEAINQSHK